MDNMARKCHSRSIPSQLLCALYLILIQKVLVLFSFTHNWGGNNQKPGGRSSSHTQDVTQPSHLQVLLESKIRDVLTDALGISWKTRKAPLKLESENPWYRFGKKIKLLN